jgi:RNA polymerase sigma-70 factor (ECF subfamily)
VLEGSDAEDAGLARRSAAGDRDAFGLLVDRHLARVHDLARRMLRDAHEAEDIAQQAFWNAWRAMGRFDAERPFRHWILRIASNLCRNRFAARRRSREFLATSDEDESIPDPPAPATPPPSETRSVRERVREAIESLPERYRLPAVLRFVHDLSMEEISEVTGDPVPTVKTHLHRARGMLAERLKDLLPGGETGGPEGGTTQGTP